MVVQVRSGLRAAVGEQILIAGQNDAGVDPFDARIAEKTDIARLGPANGGFALGNDQLAAGAEPGFDSQPRLLQNYLRQADQQADTQPQDDKPDAQRAGRQQVGVGYLKQTPANEAAQHAADHTIDNLADRRPNGLSQ